MIFGNNMSGIFICIKHAYEVFFNASDPWLGIVKNSQMLKIHTGTSLLIASTYGMTNMDMP